MNELIGRIEVLQIQRSRLVNGPTYDPKPLLRVDRMLVGSSGIVGQYDGGWVIDAHNAAHPAASSSHRPLSIGFTAHYEHMGTRFGDVPVGLAGENIVVRSGRMFSEPVLASGLVVRRADGTEVRLTSPKVARPCAQFSRFLLGSSSAQEVKDARAFLQDGVRGFICGVDHIDEAESIHVGDEVWRAS